MKEGIDTSLFLCPNEKCDNYGEVGSNNRIICWGTYGKNNTQLLYCKVCKRTCSFRRGTPLFNLKADEETFYRALACLAFWQQHPSNSQDHGPGKGYCLPMA
jgi:hypothetical protein